jgi:hypothetical protein
MITLVLSFACAAFCVWLAVRIVNRRERWAKRIAIGLIVVLFAYPLGFGPACWISSRINGDHSPLVSYLYGPVIPACRRCPKHVVRWARWYSERGAAEFWKWQFSQWRKIDGTESSIDVDE